MVELLSEILVGAFEWLASAIPVVLLGLSPVALFYLIQHLYRHSFLVYGTLNYNDRDDCEYRFAVQSGEQKPLRVDGQMVIEVKNEDGWFVRLPEVYAGVSWFRLVYEATRNLEENEDGVPDFGGFEALKCQRIQIQFKEFPAEDTWIIVCHTNPAAREVALKLEEVAALSKWRLQRLAGPEIRVTPTDKSVSSTRGKIPSLRIARLSLILALGVYLVPVLLPIREWLPLGEYFTKFELPLDGWILLGIVGFGSLLYYLVQRRSPPIAQGYWDKSVPESLVWKRRSTFPRAGARKQSSLWQESG